MIDVSYLKFDRGVGVILTIIYGIFALIGILDHRHIFLTGSTLLITLICSLFTYSAHKSIRNYERKLK